MTTIWKFDLEVKDDQDIEMPGGADLLCVQVQGGQPRIWAHVNPNQPRNKRRIMTVGTGHPISRRFVKYIGSYQMDDGALVFHVFDAGEW